MGSQRPFEEFRAQTKPRAKFNKDVKIRNADFSLTFRRTAKYITSAKRIYHVAKQHITRAKREYHFAEGEPLLRPKGVTVAKARAFALIRDAVSSSV